MMKRLLAITLFVAALVGGTASAAHAGKSCPKFSRYVGGSGGGFCVDIDDPKLIVKFLR